MPTTERIPTTVRILLGANLVSSVGSGLTLPFLLIYLHDVRHIALGVTGLLIGASAVVGIPAGPLSGALVDRLGARFMSVAGLGVSAAGTAALLAVRSPVSAVPALLLFGFGQSTLWPTWNSLFAVMVEDESLRPRVFARSFQIMNLGLGVGAMAAGSFVHVSDPSTFLVIYAVDAATTMLVAVALLALPPRAFGAGAEHVRADGRTRTGYRDVVKDPRFVRLLVASAFLAFAGYAAVDAGLVGYATHVVHVEPYVIAWAFGLNTALIVVLQPVGLRVAARVRRSTALMVCAAFFGVSWAILLVGGSFPGSHLGDGIVVAMFGVFSLGEILLAPVGGPLVTLLAPPGLVGRYNATYASVYNVLGVLGPSVAGVLLNAGLGDLYLVLLIGSAGVAAAAFVSLRHHLPRSVDRPSAAGARYEEQPTASAAS